MAIQENKLVNYLAVTLCCSVCVQRLSNVVSLLFFIFAILIFLYLLFQQKRSGMHVFTFCNEGIKGYYKAFGIFILSLLPSVLFTGDILGGLGTVLNDWIYRWFPFFAISLFVRDKQLLMKLLMAFMIVMGLDCLVAVGQSVFLDKYRPWGFSGHPMQLASYLCMVTPVLAVIVLDNRFNGNIKTIAIITLICCLTAVLLGNSRGAWLCLFIIIPLISWPYIKKNKKYMCIIGIVFCLLAGIFAASPQYQHRLLSITNITTDRSNADRLIVWKSAGNMIQDHPLVGVGPRKFKQVYDKQYKLPEVTQDLLHSHNNFIQIATEYGLIGLSGFLYFTMYLFRRNYQEMKSGNPYARMRMGILLGFLLFGMIDHTLLWSAFNKILSFMLGLLIVFDVKNIGNEEAK